MATRRNRWWSRKGDRDDHGKAGREPRPNPAKRAPTSDELPPSTAQLDLIARLLVEREGSRPKRRPATMRDASKLIDVLKKRPRRARRDGTRRAPNG